MLARFQGLKLENEFLMEKKDEVREKKKKSAKGGRRNEEGVFG